MSSPVPAADAAKRLVAFFEGLQPASLSQLGQIYAAQARFKDPFNEVIGLPAIERVFKHMFDSLHEPRFVVTQQVLQGEQCFLTWEFHFRFKSHQAEKNQLILGATHLVFAADGLVTLHRDYWDAAEELYEKLPLLGSLMRWLKGRAKR